MRVNRVSPVPARAALAAAFLVGLAGCGQGDWIPVQEAGSALKSSGKVRAARRLYDGAPPVIPHDPFGADCGICHDAFGMAVEGVGFAPASPHEATGEDGATQRCRQCHVFAITNSLFVENGFQGLEQDLRPGGRLYDGAPPTIPHPTLMRENCLACHAGPGARAEIVTAHPERTRCRQCHVPVNSRADAFTYNRIDPGPPEGS
jgi:nitrate reductase cytochrome c-type subunit